MAQTVTRLCPRCPTSPLDRVGKVARGRRAIPSAAAGDFAHPKPAKPEPNRMFTDNRHPQLYGQILDDPPIHIRPWCSRQLRVLSITLCGAKPYRPGNHRTETTCMPPKSSHKMQRIN